VSVTVSEIYVGCLNIGPAHISYIRSRNFDIPCSVSNHMDYVNRPVILSVVLYRRETSSLALNEEQKLSVSEYRVMRNILGQLSNWRTEKDFHFAPKTIRVIKSQRMRWTGRAARTKK